MNELTGIVKFDVTKLIRQERPVRIIPLGGLEQVGQNMMVVEYNKDLIIIDAGMMMPGVQLYGVDYVIPDISYIKKHISKLKGIFITHGHLDHIGAIKHILPELNYPIVYGTKLVIALIKKLLEGTPHLEKFKYEIIDPDTDIVKIGSFNIEFFRVNHSIPEPIGLAIHTPKGLLVHTGDFKIDYTPALDKVADLAKIARIGQEGVKVLFSDSTNATKPGRTPSEKVIGETLEKIIKETKGRLIIATFSSLIGRISQIIEYAKKYGRIVFLSGRSMVNNLEIAKYLGYVDYDDSLVRKLGPDVEDYPDHKVLILTTGSQGEEFSALVRIAKGEHQYLQIRPGDKILLSAAPIPGNELAVITMINELIRKGADVVTNQELDLHVSGHGRQDDLELMLVLTKPQYFVPIHGELYMRHAHKKLAMKLGMKEENIFLIDNGNVLEVYDKKVKVSEKKIHLDTIMIDGLGIGHLSGEYVLKARKIMADAGAVFLILKIDSNTKELIGNIQIESRGFVYSSEVKKIHTIIVEFTQKKYYELLKKSEVPNIENIVKQLKDELTKHIVKVVGREPMVVLSYVYIKRDNTGKIIDEINQDKAIIGNTLKEQGLDK